LERPEIYRRKALQCLLAAERLRGPAERVAVLRIAQSWLSLANRAACGTFVRAGNVDAAFNGEDRRSKPPPAIPL